MHPFISYRRACEIHKSSTKSSSVEYLERETESRRKNFSRVSKSSGENERGN